MILFADESLASIATALRKVNIEDLLLPVLVQLIVIILVARLFGMLLRKLGQPTVVGEVVAGIAMGPSLFGALFPALSAAVFVPHLEGVPDPVTGMILDLKKLKDVMEQRILSVYDHRLLNREVDTFAEAVPTVENIAIDIWNRMEGRVAPGRLFSVRVHETSELYAEYRGETE